MPRHDAVWVLSIGAVRGDGGVWGDSVPVLSEAEDGGNRHIRCAGTAVSAHL